MNEKYFNENETEMWTFVGKGQEMPIYENIFMKKWLKCVICY